MDKGVLCFICFTVLCCGIVTQGIEDNTTVEPQDSSTTETSTDVTTVPTQPSLSTTAPSSHEINLTLHRKVDNRTTICFRLMAQLHLAVPYKQVDGKQATAQLDVPSNVHFAMDTKCAPQNATVQIVDIVFDQTITLRMGFTMLEDGYAMTNLSMAYMRTKAFFPKAASEGPVHTSAEYSNMRYKTAKGGYYSCNSVLTENLGNVTLTSKNLKVQAFRTDDTETDFVGDAKACAADAKTDNIVPIAVGAALAALVVIVLIAYIIGRQRNRTGYQSV